MEVKDYEVPTIEDIFYLSLELAKKIINRGKKYDCIVGISRGGLIPTRLLSDFLDIKDIRIIRSIYYKGTGETLERPEIDISTLGDVRNKRVLIVDDVADTGDTLRMVKEEIIRKGAGKVEIATLYVKPWRNVKIDYYVAETDKWIVFPWEIREVLEDLMRRGDANKLIEKVKNRREFQEVLVTFIDRR